MAEASAAVPDFETLEEVKAELPDFESLQPEKPTLGRSPYDEARLSGRVTGPMGTFGPLNPEEVLSLPQVLSVPGRLAVEAVDIPGRIARVINPRRADPTSPDYAPLVGELEPKFPRLRVTPQEQAFAEASPGFFARQFPKVVGLANLGLETAESFARPETALTLPLLGGEGAVQRVAMALFASSGFAGLPGEIKDAIKTLGDPSASTADKTVALGRPGVSALFTGLMTKGAVRRPAVAAPEGVGRPARVERPGAPEAPSLGTEVPPAKISGQVKPQLPLQPLSEVGRGEIPPEEAAAPAGPAPAPVTPIVTPGEEVIPPKPEAAQVATKAPETATKPAEPATKAPEGATAPVETVRVYHGEGGTGGAGVDTSFFTSNPERARSYGPNVTAVDVPKDVFEAAEKARQQKGIGTSGDVILPQEWVKKAQAVEAPPAKVHEIPLRPEAPVPEAEFPPLPEGNHLVTIERRDGTRYRAARSAKEWPAAALPPGVTSGAAIHRVVLGADGKPVWSTGMLDPGEKIVEEAATAAPKAASKSTAPLELEAVEKVDVAADPRLDQPGITRKAKPNSIIVQLRDLESRPLRELVLAATGDPLTDSKTVAEVITRESNASSLVSFRESAATSTGPNGLGVYHYSMTGGGAAWTPVKQLLAARKQLKPAATAPKAPEVAAPVQAAAKAQAGVSKVAQKSGQRPAKEVKRELVGRIEGELAKLPELKGEVGFGSPKTYSGVKKIEVRPKEGPWNGSLTIIQNKGLWDVVVSDTVASGKNPVTRRQVIATRLPLNEAKALAREQMLSGNPWHAEKVITDNGKEFTPNWKKIKAGGAQVREVPETVTIEIPGDGTFKVPKTRFALERILARAKALETSAEPKKTFTESLPTKAEGQEYLKEAKREAQIPGTKKGPGIVGMGGAVPAEFEQSAQTATSIKNATVDQERVRRGLPPAMQPARRSFGEVWDRAMAQIDRDPASQDRLLDELRVKPRALTDMEDAMVLHRQIDLQNEYAKATRDVAQAFDDGRTDAVAEGKVRIAELSDKVQDIYDIGKRSGTETGRGLNARKMMAYEDFTLAKMELEKRAARGGAPLTDAERTELAAKQSRIEALQKAYDDYVARSKARTAELEIENRMAKLKLEEQGKVILPPKVILEVAERIVKQLDNRADAARARLREKMARMTAGVDPTLLVDLAEIGASHIGHLGLDFVKWSDRMIADVGEWARPHLDQIFTESQKRIESFAQRVTKSDQRAQQVTGLLKKLTPEEQRQEVINKIKELVEADEKDKLSYHLQKLARLLYQSGIKEREAMVDALHQVMQEADPEMTRREVMDAWSGYGDYKQLRKDQISVALRGMKGELQQIAKLEDMAANQPPLKSGLERRTPTDAERQLIRLVNDAKYKFQIPVQDPATQLRSALDTLKATLRNRIVDYEDRLARRDFAERPRRELVLDREALELKAKAERAKDDFQRELERDRRARRAPWQKTLDAFVKWERAFKLSSPVVFGKLTAAALTRLVTTTTEETVGAGLGHLPGLSRVARQAPREGGINTQAMARGLVEAVNKGMDDAVKTAKTGMTDLDVLLGRRGGADPDWANTFGHLHGMMKAPVKRFEYTLSLEKRIQHAIKNGVDVTDPLVQTRLMSEALDDGYRTIFMQHGFSADQFNLLVRAMEQSKRYPVGGEVAARVARFLFPIVRVPINIVAETGVGVGGVPIASMRTLFHVMNGTLDTLPPEVADSIMRQFKKGSIGLGLMALGYFSPQMVGGYDWREKRLPGTAKTAGFRVAGVDIPRWMTHAPWFELMQFGATIRHVKEQHVKGEDKGITEGMWAAGLGLADETPFYGEMIRFAQASESGPLRTRLMGEMARSTLIPQAVQKVATFGDEPGRKYVPKTMVEHLEFGLPGLRQTVPSRWKTPAEQ